MRKYNGMQHAGFSSTCEQIRGSDYVSSMSGRVDPVVCPKPRRLGLLNRSLRGQLSYQSACDSKAGSDVLEIFLFEGDQGEENSFIEVASSPPPFFYGSPPSRVDNPLVQDARFGDENPTILSPFVPIQSPMDHLSSSPNTSRKGACHRASFGNKPVVRIEGFDCLDRDRGRNRSVSALA